MSNTHNYRHNADVIKLIFGYIRSIEKEFNLSIYLDIYHFLRLFCPFLYVGKFDENRSGFGIETFGKYNNQITRIDEREYKKDIKWKIYCAPSIYPHSIYHSQWISSELEGNITFILKDIEYVNPSGIWIGFVSNDSIKENNCFLNYPHNHGYFHQRYRYLHSNTRHQHIIEWLDQRKDINYGFCFNGSKYIKGIEQVQLYRKTDRINKNHTIQFTLDLTDNSIYFKRDRKIIILFENILKGKDISYKFAVCFRQSYKKGYNSMQIADVIDNLW